MNPDSLSNYSGFTEDDEAYDVQANIPTHHNHFPRQDGLAVADGQVHKHGEVTNTHTESRNAISGSLHLHQPTASRSHPDNFVRDGPHLHHGYRQEVATSNAYHQRTTFGLGSIAPPLGRAELLERWDRSLQPFEEDEEEDQPSNFVSSAFIHFEDNTNVAPSTFTRNDYYTNEHTAQQLATFPVGPYCDHRRGVCAYGVPMAQTVEFQQELQALAVAHQFPVFDGPHLPVDFRVQNARMAAEQRQWIDEALRRSRRTRSRYADVWSTWYPSASGRSEDRETESPSSTNTNSGPTSEALKKYDREWDQRLASLQPLPADSVSDFALDASSSSAEVVDALLPTVHQGRSRSASAPSSPSPEETNDEHALDASSSSSRSWASTIEGFASQVAKYRDGAVQRVREAESAWSLPLPEESSNEELSFDASPSSSGSSWASTVEGLMSQVASYRDGAVQRVRQAESARAVQAQPIQFVTATIKSTNRRRRRGLRYMSVGFVASTE